jgi:hypothetical protein
VERLPIRLAAMDRHNTRPTGQPAYRRPFKNFRSGQNVHTPAQWERYYHGIGDAQMITYQ